MFVRARFENPKMIIKFLMVLTINIFCIKCECEFDLEKLQKLYDEAEKWHNYRQFFDFGPHILHEYTHTCDGDECLFRFKVTAGLGYSYTEKYQRDDNKTQKTLSGDYEYSYSNLILSRVRFERVEGGFMFDGTPDKQIFIAGNDLDENVAAKIPKSTWDTLVRPSRENDRGAIDNNQVCQTMFLDFSEFRREGLRFDEAAQRVLVGETKNVIYLLGSCNLNDTFK